MKFVTIAKSKDVEIKVPEDIHYSFYNSPYIGHRKTTAIDIYYKDELALAPVEEAKVKEIRWFNAPKHREDGLEKEPLVLLEIDENTVIKILHVKPKVSVGEKLYLGDTIGNCIISGHLCPWSDAHAHIEIRPLKDPYRARGAYPLNIEATARRIGNIPEISNPFEATVTSISKHYAWTRIKKLSNNVLTPLTARINSYYAFVDAGIPYYGIGGLIVKEELNDNKLSNINVTIGYNGSNIGYIVGLGSSHSILFISPMEVRVNDIKVKGVGAYINKRELKIVFSENSKPSWKEGDELTVSLRLVG